MKAQIVEQVEFFSEAELESLEFVPEELEAIEAERVPDLDSISFEDIAEELEAIFMSLLELETEGKGHSSGTKGGHSSGKSSSNKEKHQKGDQRRNQDQNINPKWQEYKKIGGKLDKSTWQKQGMPKR